MLRVRGTASYHTSIILLMRCVLQPAAISATPLIRTAMDNAVPQIRCGLRLGVKPHPPTVVIEYVRAVKSDDCSSSINDKPSANNSSRSSGGRLRRKLVRLRNLNRCTDSAEDVASRLARKFPEHVGARMVKPSQLVSVVKKLQRLLIVVPTSRDERDGTSAFKEQHTDGGKAAWTIATQQQEGRYQQQPRSPERNHDPLVLQPLSLSVPSNAHPPSPPLESQSISSTAPTNATVSSEQHTSGHRPSGVEVLPTGVQEGILNHIRDGTTSHVNEEEVVTGLGGRGEEDTHVRRGLTTRRGVVVGGTLAQQTEGVLPSPNIASMSDGYKSSLQKTDRCLLPGDKLMAQGAQTSQLLHGKIGIGREEDLNNVSEADLTAAKARMDTLFQKNLVMPNVPGYVHDRRVEFEDAVEECDWDDDSNN